MWLLPVPEVGRLLRGHFEWRRLLTSILSEPITIEYLFVPGWFLEYPLGFGFRWGCLKRPALVAGLRVASPTGTPNETTSNVHRSALLFSKVPNGLHSKKLHLTCVE